MGCGSLRYVLSFVCMWLMADLLASAALGEWEGFEGGVWWEGGGGGGEEGEVRGGGKFDGLDIGHRELACDLIL